MWKAVTCKSEEELSWVYRRGISSWYARQFAVLHYKVWTFSGRIQNNLFHFAQFILFITVGLFLAITIWAPSRYPTVCDVIMTQNIVVGFNFYHKRNILCWEISAMFEFCCDCVELHAPSSSGLDELLVLYILQLFKWTTSLKWLQSLLFSIVSLSSVI